jgi:hypothetical protein
MQQVLPLLSPADAPHKKVSKFIPHLILLLACFAGEFVSITSMMGRGPTDLSPSYVWGLLAVYGLGLFLCVRLFRSGNRFLLLLALLALMIQSLAVLLTLIVLIGPAT